MLIGALYSVFGITSQFSCSKDPKVKVNKSSELFWSVETIVRMKESARHKFVSLAVYMTYIRPRQVVHKNLSETSDLRRFQYYI